MIKTIDDIKNMEVNRQYDWKFGLITRTVVRQDDGTFTIDDFSHGWQTAALTIDDFEKIFKGRLSLSDLDWN